MQFSVLFRIISTKLNLNSSEPAFVLKFYTKSKKQDTFSEVTDYKMTILDMLDAEIFDYQGIEINNIQTIFLQQKSGSVFNEQK